MKRRWGILALACTLVACRGKIVTTATLVNTGAADASFTSEGKAVTFWADTNGAWKNTEYFPAHYEIDITAGTTKVGHVSCDTQDVHESVCSLSIDSGNEHRGDCELKLTCIVPIIPAGPASIHVVGTAGSTASNVTKMSIHLREK